MFFWVKYPLIDEEHLLYHKITSLYHKITSLEKKELTQQVKKWLFDPKNMSF